MKTSTSIQNSCEKRNEPSFLAPGFSFPLVVNPVAYIARTVLQQDLALFEIAEMMNNLAVYQGQVLEVENEPKAVPFRGDGRVQFRQVLAAHPTDERQNHFPLGLPSDSEHGTDRKAQRLPLKSTERKRLGSYGGGGCSTFGEKSPRQLVAIRERTPDRLV
jgi:hypothetical protein